MAESEKGSTFSKQKLLTLSSMSKERFTEEYKKYNEKTARELDMEVLGQVESAISSGNLENVKKLSQLIDYISESKKYASLGNRNQNLTEIVFHLVTLACKYNQENILIWLLDDKNRVSSSLFVNNANDEEFIQLFYFAIRSGNVHLICTVLNKWPGDYFESNPEQAENFLSKAYEELKLKNVPLKSEMEYFVEEKLINFRFFSEEREDYNPSIDTILERIDLVVESIALLITENAGGGKVDERFLYVARYAAQNIFVLKRQLKCTYDRLPWEEIEFCIISFVSAYLSHQTINIFFLSVLGKERLLSHLENFATKLNLEKNKIKKMDINTLKVLPNLKREEVVAKISARCSLFAGLYEDHKQMRDIYSLHEINNYIDTALSSDCNESVGQMAITRVLQIIGEHLKNTLESPKLSSTTSDLLVYSTAENICEILKDLRNSLSHSYSFIIRDQIEENANASFYKALQNDLKKIKSVIMDILYRSEVHLSRNLMQKIIKSKNFDDIKKEYNIFERITFKNIIEGFSRYSATHVYENVKEMIVELQEIIPEKTDYEDRLFKEMHQKIDSLKPYRTAEEAMSDYLLWFVILKITYESSIYNSDDNFVRSMKSNVKQALENVNFDFIWKKNVKISKFLNQIFWSVKSKLVYQAGNIKIWTLFIRLFNALNFDADKIEGIEDLKEKLKKKKIKKKSTFQFKDCGSKNVDENILNKKINKIKKILDNEFNYDATSDFTTYKNEKTMQKALEMIVLDIFSILEKTDTTLSNNLLFLESYSPSLIGKSLRDHLAHSNAIISIQLFDPTIAVLATAKFFTNLNSFQNYRIGKLIGDRPSETKKRFLRGLKILDNQIKLFIALEEGNVEKVKSFINEGAEINVRDNDLRTPLHYVAKSSNIEIVKFVFSNIQHTNTYVDKNRVTPLHIAAAFGISSSMEYFIHNGFSVKAIDNMNRTPLHYAVLNCHKRSVEILVEMDTNINQKDFVGFAPIHLAVMKNNREIVEFLLHKGIDIDCKVSEGFTPLHIAAVSGFIELFNLFIEKGANVNTKSEISFTPLHSSCLQGHIQIVKLLISKGANISVQSHDGCTALHYALQNGHEDIAQILLDHEASVNVADKVYANTPLHYAAGFGLKNITEMILSEGASVNAKTNTGLTPLHLSASNGHNDIVNTLLQNKAAGDCECVFGFSPLHYSALHGHRNVAEVLIQNRADVYKQNKQGLTSLHLCSLNGNTKFIETLIANGAKVDATDFNDATPLHLGALKNHKDSVDVLLKYGADVHAKDSNFRTTLHYGVINCYSEKDLFLCNVNNIAIYYNDFDTKSLSFTSSPNSYDETDIVKLLIQHNININALDKNNQTPLHLAAICGNDLVIDILIKHGADINFQDTSQMTPLHYAVKYLQKESFNLLIKNGANVNLKDMENCTSLCYAVKYKGGEIVKALINKGADVNVDDGHPLKLAAMEGNKNAVKMLLQSSDINPLTLNNALHEAAAKGYLKLAEALIIKGADIKVITTDCLSNLHCSEERYNEFVKLLIEKDFNINKVSSINDTLLHIAAVYDYNTIVEMLLKANANTNAKNIKNLLPIELAVYHDHLQVVDTILHHTNADINAVGDNGTLLHICAEGGKLSVAEYLVSNGADINATNFSGLSPIHIAARHDQVNIVEYFHKRGYNINDSTESDCTLLHSAISQNSLKVIRYLLENKAKINTIDKYGLSPLYYAASYGFKETAEHLINKGAFYNTGLQHYVGTNNVHKLLDNTKMLFKNIKQNEPDKVENIIKEGVFINALDVNLGSPLHYSSSNGYGTIVDILLKNKANPNVVGKGGSTPLHYIIKFNHLNIVISLLSSGAIYNFRNDIGKIPQDYASKEVKKLFSLIDNCFKKVQNSNSDIISDLQKIKCAKTMRVLANACNEEHQTLLVSAMRNGFPKSKELKMIFERCDAPDIFQAELFICQEKYEEVEHIYSKIYENRKISFGEDSLLTIDSLIKLVRMLLQRRKYQEALSKCQDAYVQQKNMLGSNNIDTLNTRSLIALILYHLGREEKALSIFHVVAPMQEELLGARHEDTIATKFHMALVLASLKKFEEALNINYECFNYIKEILGTYNPLTLSAHNNIAMVLCMQGKYQEALEIYKQVYGTRKVVLEPEHSDTLRALGNIAEVLLCLQKDDEALKTFQKVLNIQKTNFGPKYPDTLHTVFNVGQTLFRKGKHTLALKIFTENIGHMRDVFEPDHSDIKAMEVLMEAINFNFKLNEVNISSISDDLTHTFTAVSTGDVKNMKYLLKQNPDINVRDDKGQTLLHVASYNGHIDAVKLLLSNNADATTTTNKGNTPLHVATLKGHSKIVEVLLQNVKQTFPNKYDNFINAQTISGGKTALHVAAEKGSVDIVKSLLTFGAVYDMTDKGELKPVNLSEDQEVIDILKLAEETFELAKKGNNRIIKKLEWRSISDIASVLNTQNIQRQTSFLVALVNNHKDLARSLLKLLQRCN